MMCIFYKFFSGAHIKAVHHLWTSDGWGWNSRCSLVLLHCKMEK